MSSERFYTKEDLHDLVGMSSDGKIEVYTSIFGGAGDTQWTQVVTYNKSSGKITFLTYLNDWEYAIVGPDNALICNRLESLDLFDIKTVKKGKSYLNFPFEENGELRYMLVGLYYDSKSKQFIMAYRDLKADEEGIKELQSELEAKKDPRPVTAALKYKPLIYVMILNKQGKEIKKLNTDLRIFPYVDGCGTRTVKILKNKDGSYTLDGGFEGDEAVINP